MIIQALVKRYEDTLQEKIPFGWQTRQATYVIDLPEQILRQEEERSFILPLEPNRTSKPEASFLCDNGGYICGLDKKKGKEKFELARELHKRILSNTESIAARALITYFDNPQIFDDKDAIGKNIVFRINGRYATDYPEIREAWNKHFKKLGGNDVFCLITGAVDKIWATHSKIKLAGGQASGSSLVSLNIDSPASYGKTSKDPAADIGKYAAFAYVTALNDLLKDSIHKKRLAQDTLVYWAEGEDNKEAEVFSWFSEPQESDTSKLDGIMRLFTTGKKVRAEGCNMEKRFHLLCLSPNAGRISVRFFHADSFGNILSNIAEHYQNLEIIGNSKFPYIPPWIILSETTIKKSAGDAAPLLSGQMMKTIISGGKYPITLYNAIMTRIRAGEEINQTKAAVIKAVLMKNFYSEVATVALNKDSKNIPYTLGRLFYVLEHLQEQANGTSTIRQRYFSSACSNPGNVFPTLLSLSMHHADKLENPTWFEIQKGDLIDRLNSENPFPQTLGLQQQGEFIVGYYHQQQNRYTKKEEK